MHNLSQSPAKLLVNLLRFEGRMQSGEHAISDVETCVAKIPATPKLLALTLEALMMLLGLH